MARVFAALLSCITLLCTPVSATADNAHLEQKRTYRFGVITLNHPLVIYQQYLPFLDYLGERQPWTFELVLEQQYHDIVRRLEQGSLDIALLAGRTYLQAAERTPIVPISAVLGVDGTPTTRSLIVAREDRTDLNSLQDLKGKRFAFGSRDSTASHLAPLDHLIGHDMPPEVFRSCVNLPTHDAVARAVLRGEFDGGAMGEPMALRYLGSGLKVIDATKPFPGFIIVARADVPEEVRTALQRVLHNIDMTDPATAVRAASWNEVLRHGFAPVDLRTYELFRAMEHRVGLDDDCEEVRK